ncbi:hypothetical protein Taro_016459 [Colocasia esculenta]|uniref:W2 domain-containing protein n=1 Tax=Colocasia esculenta TaxID=4460 RepID=A0A843UKC6_COLES|nr:hypothetical protein [Colocasia esculenta]
MYISFLFSSFYMKTEYVVLQILVLLYDQDVLTEDAILAWAREKEGADESDKVLLQQSESFIQWLQEAEEDEEEEEE